MLLKCQNCYHLRLLDMSLPCEPVCFIFRTAMLSRVQ